MRPSDRARRGKIPVRRLRVIGILLAWPPCAAAQDTTTVTGVVIDGATGIPIPDVRVDSGLGAGHDCPGRALLRRVA